MNVVFDFGAVLFTLPLRDLVREQLGDLAPDEATVAALTRDIFHHPDWLAFDRGALTLGEVTARQVRRLQLGSGRVARLFASIPERLVPIDGTVELLRALKARRDAGDDGVRLFYLSNMPAPFARHLEAQHGFLQWFDGGVFSGDVQAIKPEPQIYDVLAQRHALQPARTVFIDDLAANLDPARALGWQTIHFQSPQGLADDLRRLMPTLRA